VKSPDQKIQNANPVVIPLGLIEKELN